MKLTYEDCKELKDAGFPQEQSAEYWCSSFEDIDGYGTDYVPTLAAKTDRDTGQVNSGGGSFASPTLSELIEACGEEFRTLQHPSLINAEWVAHGGVSYSATGFGSSPEQAVKNLYCALNKKS